MIAHAVPFKFIFPFYTTFLLMIAKINLPEIDHRPGAGAFLIETIVEWIRGR
jgi:hypothetical protein